MRHRTSAASRVVAWTGALLFSISLTYCGYTFILGMGPAATASAAWRPLVFDAALFLAFALHHSIFARTRVRAFVARLAPDAVERSVYVWVASLLLIVACALWRPLPGTAWRVDGPAAWWLHGVQLFGVWLTLRSAAAIDVLELAGVRQLERDGHPPVFKTRGPYGWMRHPIYAGWFLMVLAHPQMTMTRLLFAGVTCLYLLVAIPLEEASLRATTGGAYDRYAEAVRWKLIPGIY